MRFLKKKIGTVVQPLPTVCAAMQQDSWTDRWSRSLFETLTLYLQESSDDMHLPSRDLLTVPPVTFPSIVGAGAVVGLCGRARGEARRASLLSQSDWRDDSDKKEKPPGHSVFSSSTQNIHYRPIIVLSAICSLCPPPPPPRPYHMEEQILSVCGDKMSIMLLSI